MALPLYLAMTAAEMRANSPLPERLGYMACHFSPYGTGLSNCPDPLPEASMLILNDRTPICGHDRVLILRQLKELVESFKCSCVLLDFQRPGVDESALLAEAIVNALPCPVAVSDIYAQGLDCPVFLPPVPLDVSLASHISPWQGREIWLEAALDGAVIQLNQKGYTYSPLPCPGTDCGHADEKLHCHYNIKTDDEAASFTLLRTRDDLHALFDEAETLGVTQAVGLWQELR